MNTSSTYRLLFSRTFSTKRKPISALKNILFEKYKDRFNLVNCCLCNTKLDYRFMNIGHYISHKNGGSDTIDNMRPICQSCNSSLGSMNVIDFIKRYRNIEL